MIGTTVFQIAEISSTTTSAAKDETNILTIATKDRGKISSNNKKDQEQQQIATQLFATFLNLCSCTASGRRGHGRRQLPGHQTCDINLK